MITNPSWLVYDAGQVWNTRFNPTVNGYLHIGHLLIALVNEHEAHASGGKFTVRLDDNQPDWLSHLGYEKVNHYSQAIKEDLEPFVEVDAWTSQLHDYHEALWSQHTLIPLRPMPVKQSNGKVYSPIFEYIPEWIPEPEVVMYPYAPHYTIEKAFCDYFDGVNWLIRGVDIVTEYALYEYVCEMHDLPRVRQTFIPRLKRLVGDIALQLSKTNGGSTIRSLVKKHGEDGVIDALRSACLIDPGGDFAIENLMPEPVIIL